MEALFSDYEEVRKSGLFDAEYYLVTYPDVADRNLDPLVHYLEEGAGEGRNPYPDFDAGFYLEQCRARGEQPSNPLLHYLRIGAARGFKTRREAGDGKSPKPTDQIGKPPILVAIESVRVSRDDQIHAASGRRRSRTAESAGVPVLLLHIDSRRVVGGAAEAPVRGTLDIGGWELAKAGVAAIEIAIDGAPVAVADCGLRR